MSKLNWKRLSLTAWKSSECTTIQAPWTPQRPGWPPKVDTSETAKRLRVLIYQIKQLIPSDHPKMKMLTTYSESQLQSILGKLTESPVKK